MRYGHDMRDQRRYSNAAYAADGKLWWESDIGDEQKIASWLAFNKSVGDVFTTQELRDALGNNSNEHFQRRVRALRDQRDGWQIPSRKYDRSLGPGQYRVDKVGWHPALGVRPIDNTAISARTRRGVLERDNFRCALCGVIAGEPYPGNPAHTAVLTVGHVTPRDRGGSGRPSNLRTECAICNETVRSDTRASESFEVLRISIDNLRTADRAKLLEWVQAERRVRDQVDEAYDRYRMLSPGDQAGMREHLQATTRA